MANYTTVASSTPGDVLSKRTIELGLKAFEVRVLTYVPVETESGAHRGWRSSLWCVNDKSWWWGLLMVSVLVAALSLLAVDVGASGPGGWEARVALSLFF